MPQDIQFDTSRVPMADEEKQKAAREKLRKIISGEDAITLQGQEVGKPEEAPPELNDFLKKLFPPAPIPKANPLHTLGLPFTDPRGVATGVIEAGGDLIHSLGNDVAGMWKALTAPPSPEEQARFGTSGFVKGYLQQTAKRAGDFIENVPVVGGVVRNIEQNYAAAPKPPDATFGARVSAGLGATGKAIGDFFTDELGDLLTGQEVDPKTGEEVPLTGEKFSKDVASLAMKAGLLRGAAARTNIPPVTELLEGVPKDVGKFTRSAGEIDAAELAKQIKQRQLGEKLGELMKARRGKGAAATGEDLSSGWEPLPLDERGQQAAEQLQAPIEGLHILYHSDIPRAAETARIAANGKIPLQVEPGLRPQNVGEWAGKPTDEVHPELKRMAAEEPGNAPPGGESHLEFQMRALPTFRKLLDESEANPDKAIGFVTHSQPLELFQSYIDAGTPANFKIDPANYAQQSAPPAGSLINVFKTPEGLWQMGQAEKVDGPGLWGIRHGETTWDAPTTAAEENSTVLDPNRPILPQEALREQVAKLPPEAIPLDPNVLDSEVMRQFYHRAVFDDLGRQSLLDYVQAHPEERGQGMMMNAMADLASKPQLGYNIIKDVVDARGVEPAELQDAFTTVYKHTLSKGGYDLQGLSDTLDQLYDETFPASQRGSVAERASAMQLLRDISTLKRAGSSGPTSSWNTLAGKFGKVERLRQGILVSPLRTAIGIFESQLGLLGADFSDALNTDLTNVVKGVTRPLVTGQGRPTLPETSEVYNLFASTANRMGVGPLKKLLGDRYQVDRVLDGVPRIKGEMMSGLLFDADSSLLGHTLNLARQATKEGIEDRTTIPGNISTITSELGKPYGRNVGFDSPVAEGAYNITHMATDFLNTFNRFQEAEFRKVAFGSRLRSNLAQIEGAPTYGPALVDYLSNIRIADDKGNAVTFVPRKAGEVGPWARPTNITGDLNLAMKNGDMVPIDPAVREAIVDAERHALRQTYAYTPNGGLFGNALKVLRPITFIGPTFPRSMMNNLMWQLHHSPTWLADAFTSDFRDAFYNTGKELAGRAASRDASRKIGQAMTGALLMNAALHLSNGGFLHDNEDPSKQWRVGPKPWLLFNGDKDADGNPLYEDVSSFQPFVNYLDLAHMLNAKLQHQDDHTKFSEVLEHYLNSRTDNVPLFGVEDMVRNMDSKDPVTVQNALWKYLGQYVGSWGTALRGLREEGAAIKQEPWLAVPATIAGHGVAIVPAAMRSGYQDVRPSLTGEGAFAPVAQQFAPSALLQKVDVFRGGKPDIEASPAANMFKGERRPMTPFEEAMVRSNIDPWDVSKNYKDPHATKLVREAIGQIIASPGFKIGDKTLNQYAAELTKIKDPTLSQVIIQQILPVLHDLGETLAKDRDARATTGKGLEEGGFPMHFAQEETKPLTMGSSEAQQKLLKSLYEAWKKRATTQ